MIARINRKKYQLYGLDIESHNDEESIAKRETSMWLGCLLDENSKIDDENSYFYTMPELLERLESMTKKTRKKINGILQQRPCNNVAIYIYNLSFEWSFILPVLIEKGFTFKANISKEDEYCFNSVSTKSVSSVWQAQIKFSKNGGIVLFKDLAKIYGGGLASVAKAMKLPTQKGEIDYRKNRLHDYVITEEEKEYCFKDTRIIVDILLKEIEKGDKDFFNSSSMASLTMRKLIKRGYPRACKPYQKFREQYPVLDQEESDFVRKSFAGGITYATDKWQFKDIEKTILHIDAHQMYPTQMYSKAFPYGKGEYFKGKPTTFFKHSNCCHIRVSYSFVRIHTVIKLIGLSAIEGFELYVWDFEIPTMYKCYGDLEIEYIDGYCYPTRFLPWREYFKDNYLKRLEAKKNGDSYNTLYYKLLNNSAYGKFGEKPHNEIFENYIRADGIIDSLIRDKEEIKTTAKYTYIPLGSAIPAYSRVMLCETALKFGWENVLYFDTDSIFMILNDETRYVWEHEINQEDFLGGWAVEEISRRAQFTAPKRYKLETNEGKTIIKAGGINFDFFKQHTYKEEYQYNLSLGMTSKEASNTIQIPYDEVNIITSTWKVQRAYRCKGGTLIEFQDKSMDIQKKYQDIYNRNH